MEETPPTKPAESKPRQDTFPTAESFYSAFASFKKFINSEQAQARRKLDQVIERLERQESVLGALAEFLEREAEERKKRNGV